MFLSTPYHRCFVCSDAWFYSHISSSAMGLFESAHPSLPALSSMWPPSSSVLRFPRFHCINRPVVCVCGLLKQLCHFYLDASHLLLFFIFYVYVWESFSLVLQSEKLLLSYLLGLCVAVYSVLKVCPVFGDRLNLVVKGIEYKPTSWKNCFMQIKIC